MNRVVMTFAVLLVAGCFGESPSGEKPAVGEPPANLGGGKPQETIPLEVLPNGTVPEVPAHLVLEGCTGWNADHFLMPESMVPGEPLPGWENDDPTADPVAGIGVHGFSCNKIAIGPIERGPINFLFETHTKGSVPHDCLSDVGAGHRTLVQAIISDAEVAAYLNSTYGMPAYFASFQHSIETLAAVESRTWTWVVEGHGESTVTILTEGTGEELEQAIWYWWQRGNGLGRLEMIERTVSAPYSDRLGYGKFDEPMLMAQVADGMFAETADYMSEVVTTNTFAFHADTICTPPDKGTM